VTDLRRVEVLREGVWTPVRLAEVKRGERFRMDTLDDGELHEHTAATDGFWCDLGSSEPSIRARVEMKNSAIAIELEEA
jgi:hypothetical protein